MKSQVAAKAADALAKEREVKELVEKGKSAPKRERKAIQKTRKKAVPKKGATED